MEYRSDSTKWEPFETEIGGRGREYDHFTGGRFRHGTKLLRWRPDKARSKCRMDASFASRIARYF